MKVSGFELNKRDLVNYGHAKARGAAFDALRYAMRESGVLSGTLSEATGWRVERCERSVSGPAVMTLEYLGAYAEAMGYEIEIKLVKEP